MSNESDIPFDATPYPQPHEALEFLIPREVTPSMYRPKGRLAQMVAMRKVLEHHEETMAQMTHQPMRGITRLDVEHAVETYNAHLDAMGS